MNDQAQAYFTEFRNWMKKPYSNDLTVFGWIMFIGLVMIVSFLWAGVIGQIKKAAS